ncbi:hypothetical protein VOLCADRAFT_92122 [Volvox carteri f. nagariensis]|uniref:Uncharacterized protein n=1 Tax=Volvox carteri f. nagariensis TaxID=3068 RepID=D8TYN4_VOLCA|nr:uncharacterized protein VOLCADRAFT_92122 [Volvox carteri f. nagariensis]EFJ47424.1 hypothetical protein VOLCADRAFT_92122 [Volvox carteri f. nagariensis]|eukprot:XP_002951613.1 hypothetical protein VOLCADRAFT_92122 [Volvox carteri f. nagariensis]
MWSPLDGREIGRVLSVMWSRWEVMLLCHGHYRLERWDTASRLPNDIRIHVFNCVDASIVTIEEFLSHSSYHLKHSRQSSVLSLRRAINLLSLDYAASQHKPYKSAYTSNDRDRIRDDGDRYRRSYYRDYRDRYPGRDHNRRDNRDRDQAWDYSRGDNWDLRDRGRDDYHCGYGYGGDRSLSRHDWPRHWNLQVEDPRRKADTPAAAHVRLRRRSTAATDLPAPQVDGKATGATKSAANGSNDAGSGAQPPKTSALTSSKGRQTSLKASVAVPAAEAARAAAAPVSTRLRAVPSVFVHFQYDSLHEQQECRVRWKRQSWECCTLKEFRLSYLKCTNTDGTAHKRLLTDFSAKSGDMGCHDYDLRFRGRPRCKCPRLHSAIVGQVTGNRAGNLGWVNVH